MRRYIASQILWGSLPPEPPTFVLLCGGDFANRPRTIISRYYARMLVGSDGLAIVTHAHNSNHAFWKPPTKSPW